MKVAIRSGRREGEPSDDGEAGASGRLGEVARVFLRLGLTAFGGPAAHIALMEEEVVRRRGWVSREEFLDLVSAANLIPGPNSTELAIHLGYRRAGWAGLGVAGICFILPAALLVTGLAWAYVRFGKLPDARNVMQGMTPVILMIVLRALVTLAKSAVKTRGLAVATVAAGAAAWAGMHELLVLFATGVGVLAARRWAGHAGAGEGSGRPRGAGMEWMGGLGAATAVPAAGAAAGVAFGLGPLFLFFLKVGSVLFGSGYVLLAFLRADLVDRWGWLTEAQLLDAVAVGQFTPGPLFTTATFIGYLLGGGWGAVVATVGIFLPAFVFVALSGPIVGRLRASAAAAAFLDGLNVASLALMAVVTWELGRGVPRDPWSIAVAVVAAVALARTRCNSAWFVAAGAAVGWVAGRW